MQFRQAFRAIMSARGYSQAALAEKVGVSPTSVSSMLSKGNPSINAVSAYLGAMGYSVALVPNGTNLPEGSHVLEPSER